MYLKRMYAWSEYIHFSHKSDRKDEQLFLSNTFSPVSDLIHTVDK